VVDVEPVRIGTTAEIRGGSDGKTVVDGLTSLSGLDGSSAIDSLVLVDAGGEGMDACFDAVASISCKEERAALITPRRAASLLCRRLTCSSEAARRCFRLATSSSSSVIRDFFRALWPW
jgi:hypothetical protein